MAAEAIEQHATGHQASSDGACPFCQHLATEEVQTLDWHVVAQSPEFVAVPSLGALLPGWLVVVPRRHVLNLAAMRRDEKELLGHFLGEFLPTWRSIFGPLSRFEHGPHRAGSPVGCSIDHAHLHVVPTSGQALIDMSRYLLGSNRWRPVIDLDRAASEAAAAGQDYLSLRGDDCGDHLVVGDKLPSQALRRVLARRVGRPEHWDWRDDFQSPNVVATIEKFGAARLRSSR